MSDSWRIQVNEVDRSRTVLTDVGNIGAAVIRAAKGPEAPVLISRGDEGRILDIFGAPTVTYRDTWEAIEYNKEAPIWLSAPFNSDALYGGVFVTTGGSVPFSVGLDDPANLDLTAVDGNETIGVGNGIQTVFNHTISFFQPQYVNQSVGLTIDHNGTPEVVALSPTDAEPEVLSGTISGGAGGTVSGTFTRATGALALTFTAAPLSTDTLYVTFEVDIDSITYFTLFSASPRTDDQGVIVTYDTASGFFTVTLSMKDYRSVWRSVDEYTVSITPGTFDGFGAAVYVETVFEDDDYLSAVDNSLVYSSFTDDTSRVELAGGSRGTFPTLTELTAGWAYFQQKNTYGADIFMDYSADAGVPALFDTLRDTYQKYKSYILPLPYNENAATATATKAGYSINNRGLAFYWNWGKVREGYTNTIFWSPLTGKVGVKYAQMDNVFNGLAPSWIDENEHGGQLGSGIIEMDFDPSETDLQSLDTNGINPIIFHPVYGVMIVSQRTAQSPGNLSDSSWIAHSRLFDYIIAETIEQILTYQLTKLNDEVHRQLAASLGEQLISPIVNIGLLREAIPKCDRENNTDDVLARREFVFTWGIKVTPFSERIIFNFVNVQQTVSVEEVI